MMDTPITPSSSATAIDQALEYYRLGDWDSALKSFDEASKQGALSPELEELREDIRLKQIYDRMGSAPVAAAPKRPRRAAGIVLIGGGATAFVGLAALLVMALLLPNTPARAIQPQAQIIGALPTAAPTAIPTPEPTPPPPPIGTLLVEPVAGGALTRAADNIALIFDASGSMLAQLGDRPKIDIAHEAVGQLVQVLPDGANLALRTYGRNRPDDCSDVELVQPLGPLDRAGLAAQVQAIVPVNYARTPIASSLEQVALDLSSAGESLVVLLSDGEESCDGDPVAVAAKIHADNPLVRISVVGFAVDEAQQQQLAAIAAAGGGSFYAATNVTQLADALRQTVAPVYRVFGQDGAELQKADLGATIELEPGQYSVSVGEIEPLVLDAIEIEAGWHTVITVREEAGALQADIHNDRLPAQ